MAGLLGAVESERDERLLEDHCAGDNAAFGRLYELHYDRLLRFVRHRVRDYHLAEEITQDAFVRAYGAAAHLKDGRRFYPWLTVIAQRLAIDHFRRSGRVSPVAEFEGELGFEPAADEHLIAACEAEALEAALGRVRERHRQVLRWQNEGMSYEDIAVRLNAPITTVPPLLFRARQALRREYLAVTEAERIAAVPVLGALAAWFRRCRVRGTQLASWVPEPAMFTAQLASAALIVGIGLSGPSGTAVDWTASPSNAGAADFGASAQPMSGAVVADADDLDVQGEPSDQRSGERLDGTAPYIGLGGSGREQAQEYVRQSPYSFEAGPVGFGVDPERDVSSLRELVPGAGQ